MKTIKHLLARYTHFVWSILEPLGPWGILAVAFMDSAAIGIPLDPVVAGYVYAHPPSIWLYVFMAAIGSVLGSLIPYGIGRAGGELLLLKHVDRQRFERLRDRFENQEFFAMMVPAMLPPPTPFKLFLLAAGVFEMRPLLFMSAIFSGRVVRFLILGFLVVRFGPGIVSLMTAIMARHLIWVILGFVFLICLFVYEFKFRRPRAAQREGPTQAL